LAIANKALRAFEVPTRKGGVLYVDKDDGDWWYEEYASASSIPSGVLNGFVIALLGIYDFCVFTHDQLAEQLFDEGVSTLCRHINDFDPNYPFKLSYYDRYEHTVSIEYHLLHIKLMQTMHEITKKVIFRKYKERWERYKEEWLSHRSYRWLSKIYYLKSGSDLKHSIALLVSHVKNKLTIRIA